MWMAERFLKLQFDLYRRSYLRMEEARITDL